MAYDGVIINAIVNELKANFINGRLDKIHQPDKDRLHLSIWCKGKTQKLLLTCNSASPRIHITVESRQNPVTPPMFCMLARKHLLGGRVVDIVQPNFERIVELHIENINEMGDYVVKRLIIECMGKHSNIILTDDNSKIIDSIKHITHETSRIREILPGRQYVYPPSQNKLNPFEVSSESVHSLFVTSYEIKKADKFIAETFTGISRTTANEIYHNSNNEEKSLADSFLSYFERVRLNDYLPTLLVDNLKHPVDIFPFPYKQFDLTDQIGFESVSKLVEHFYSERERLHNIEQSYSNLTRTVKSHIERLDKKLATLAMEQQSAEQSDKYRLYGELITANLHLPLSNQSEVELANYYDPEAPKVLIPMDKNKTPSQNAQEYFKKYTKSKNATKMLTEHISLTTAEIDYLESQLDNIDKCTEEIEFDEIRNELCKEGYIKDNPQNKSKSVFISQPHRFMSSDGFEIFVGKNNVQNDTLTLKTAAVNDMWMHTKNIPGSHVIIKTNGSTIPQTTITEAAMLAAYFSKAKKSSNVPVDYCPRKFVKKPRGSKPGMVTYDKYRTLYVTPTESMVKAIMGSK